MSQFVRIEARISDRGEMRLVARKLEQLAKRLTLIANGPNDDEAALLQARDRIKTVSQLMRKGLKDAD